MITGMNKCHGWVLLPLLLLALALPALAQEKTSKSGGGSSKRESRSGSRASKAIKKPVGPSATVLRLRKLYHYIYQGNLKDLKKNQSIATQLIYKAKGLKREAKQSKSKQAKYEEAQALADLFTKLVAQNRSILLAFEGNGQDSLITEAAMAEIPDLEREIVQLSGKQIKRDWLTFAEVEERRRSEMRYKRGVPEALPYSKGLWEEKRDKRKRNK